MKTYLVARREELKKRQNKGFTLMEMLIVVAIIAVLIAIAIPVFTSQLEKSRDSVSVANMRSAYAEVMTCVLAGSEGQTEVTFTPASTGEKVAGTYAMNIDIQSQQANTWSGVADELPWIGKNSLTTANAPEDPGTSGTKTITFTINANSEITAVSLT